MNLQDIEAHWKNWANQFKTDLRATTKTSTAKQIEISALIKAISALVNLEDNFSLLEVGCGNGHNCFPLKSAFNNAQITGVDFIPEMVENANKIKAESKQDINFYQGNILELEHNDKLTDRYDIVLTVRCLINLNNNDIQQQGLAQLVNKLSPDGHLLLIENQISTYEKQNNLRELLSLSPRSPATFNHFMDETALMNKASELGLSLVNTYNISSLHDIILYALTPYINDGEIDYNSPLVQAAADLMHHAPLELSNSFGEFGQNKFFVFKK